MTTLEVIRAIAEPLTALAAIVAAIKSWLSHRKAKDIETMLIQQQSQQQVQSQQLTVNVHTGGSTAPPAEVTFSEEEPPGES